MFSSLFRKSISTSFDSLRTAGFLTFVLFSGVTLDGGGIGSAMGGKINGRTFGFIVLLG